MKGRELAEVRDAIMEAFKDDDFDAFLLEELDYNREHNVADGAFKKVVSDVLADFEHRGLEAALIAKVAAARPLKEAVQQVYQKYAAAQINETLRAAVDASRAAAMAQFGLLGEVKLQSEGAKPAAPTEGATGGLEKTITDLGYIQYHTWLRRMIALEGRVCRVEIKGLPRGTGFLVGPDLVLTNYHVVESVIAQTSGGGIELRFDYGQAGIAGTPVKAAPVGWLLASGPYCPEENTLKPETAQPDAEHLDFALIKLAEAIGSQPLFPHLPDSALRGWVEIPKAPPHFGEIKALMILQHPQLNPASLQTAPLQLALDTKPNLELRANNRRLRYKTNTEAGSSGSPCFDIHCNLVALHHLGDPGGLNSPPQYNQGIPINAILDRLTVLGLHERVTQPLPAPAPAPAPTPAPAPSDTPSATDPVRPPPDPGGGRPPPPPWHKLALIGLAAAVVGGAVLLWPRGREPDPLPESPPQPPPATTTTATPTGPVTASFITKLLHQPKDSIRVVLQSVDTATPWQREMTSDAAGRVTFQVEPARAHGTFTVTLPDYPAFVPLELTLDGVERPLNVPP